MPVVLAQDVSVVDEAETQIALVFDVDGFHLDCVDYPLIEFCIELAVRGAVRRFRLFVRCLCSL